MLRGYLAIVALVSAASAYRVPLLRMAAEPGMTVGEAKVRFYSEQGVGHALVGEVGRPRQGPPPLAAALVVAEEARRDGAEDVGVLLALRARD